MSALPPIADMCAATRDVRFVPIAYIKRAHHAYVAITAETLMFAKFKYDQSMDTFWLRFIIVEEGASHASLVAARSSSIDE